MPSAGDVTRRPTRQPHYDDTSPRADAWQQGLCGGPRPRVAAASPAARIRAARGRATLPTLQPPRGAPEQQWRAAPMDRCCSKTRRQALRARSQSRSRTPSPRIRCQGVGAAAWGLHLEQGSEGGPGSISRPGSERARLRNKQGPSGLHQDTAAGAGGQASDGWTRGARGRSSTKGRPRSRGRDTRTGRDGGATGTLTLDPSAPVLPPRRQICGCPALWHRR